MFCTRDLGRNEVVEPFPVGRRLVFDAEKGRLWAVCRACEGWNLTPLEERWEAIEACERLYRGVRTRVSTGELGLARLPEGLDLVRVGRPLRPEFAAWRYGDQFGRRRRRYGALAAGAVAGGGAVVLGSQLLGLGTFPIVWYAMQLWRPEQTAASFRDDDGRRLEVRRSQLQHVLWARDDDGGPASPGWYLSVPCRGGRAELRGRTATTVAARLLRRINARGAGARRVGAAVELIEAEGSPGALVDGLVRARAADPGLPEFRRVGWREVMRSGWPSYGKVVEGSLARLPIEERLALEMALHEDRERRAMLEGELAELEAAWRDAEELAAISDGLLVSPATETHLDQLRSTLDSSVRQPEGSGPDSGPTR